MIDAIENNTALHLATMGNNPSIVKLLLDYKVLLFILNNNNKSSLNLARDNPEIFAILQAKLNQSENFNPPSTSSSSPSSSPSSSSSPVQLESVINTRDEMSSQELNNSIKNIKQMQHKRRRI